MLRFAGAARLHVRRRRLPYWPWPRFAAQSNAAAAPAPDGTEPPVPGPTRNPLLDVNLSELGVTVVRDRYTAKRVLQQLMAVPKDRHHACDTEVAGELPAQVGARAGPRKVVKGRRAGVGPGSFVFLTGGVLGLFGRGAC